jgi:hypothetical protein
MVSFLFPSEQVLKSLNGVVCALSDGKSLSGWLILTNQRLAFVRTGFVDTKIYAEKENFEKGLQKEGSFSIPLGQIIEVKAVSRRGPDSLEVYYQTPSGFRANAFMRMGAEWEEWVELINQTKAGTQPPTVTKITPTTETHLIEGKFPTEIWAPIEEKKVPHEPLGIRDLRTRIQDYLRQIAGSYEIGTDDSYAVRVGTTKVIVHTDEWVKDKSLVNVVAIVAAGVEPTKDLMEFLNAKNADLVFGKFFVMKEQKLVLCQHALLGDKMDCEELETAIMAIGAVADRYDEEIVSRFGGMCYIDFEKR